MTKRETMTYDITILLDGQTVCRYEANNLNSTVKTIRSEDLVDRSSVIINGIIIDCKDLVTFNSVELKKQYFKRERERKTT